MFWRKYNIENLETRIGVMDKQIELLKFKLEYPCKYKKGLIKSGEHKGRIVISCEATPYYSCGQLLWHSWIITTVDNKGVKDSFVQK